MDRLLYHIARMLIGLLQALPLRFVARLGRMGGTVACLVDRRHRRVAQRNLSMCLGQEKSPAEIRALARENFKRIGENFACAVKTAAMSYESLQPHIQFTGPPVIISPPAEPPPRGVVAAIGHFGNFELYARFGQLAPAYKSATTYRGLRQPSLDRLLQSLRARANCRFFERRFEGSELKAFMNQPAVMLGLLADQHAGQGGLRLPFLGHDCSTSAAPALFALRYHCALHPAICYRVGLAQWRIEAGPAIPTHSNGEPRAVEDIMLDVNRAFEVAVRRDPANWFWVHNRWKGWTPRRQAATGAQAPTSEPHGSEPQS
jgi:KDO2-lipid IV(A) lauroyltransferase